MFSDSDPRYFHIEQDAEGFFVADDYGQDQTPTRRMSNYRDAEEVLSEMVSDYLANYEPPDPPGWEGGFARNH